jgi:hypothetical protein
MGSEPSQRHRPRGATATNRTTSAYLDDGVADVAHELELKAHVMQGEQHRGCGLLVDDRVEPSSRVACARLTPATGTDGLEVLPTQ